MQKKYKLLDEELIIPSTSTWNSAPIPMFRIQALRDIPEAGVKRGQIGGYVSHPAILSHEGACWIGGNAQAISNVQILDDAQIRDNAVICSRFEGSSITIRERSFIRDKAEIITLKKMGIEPKFHTLIAGSTNIGNQVKVENVRHISGNVHISNHAIIQDGAILKGTITIRDYAHIKANVQLLGNTSVIDQCIVHEASKLVDCHVSEDAQIAAKQTFIDREFMERAIYSNEEEVLPQVGVSKEGDFSEKKTATVTKENPAVRLFDEVKANIAAYETDIVKIIKYPAMVDQGIETTLEMTIALKKATRLAEDVNSPEFTTAVEELERKFFIAESHAIKLSSSMLSDDEKKKTKDAKVMLDKATDEASTENEKKIAFVQGFKQLEGIITVPEIAIDTFRVKVGLQEIAA